MSSKRSRSIKNLAILCLHLFLACSLSQQFFHKEKLELKDTIIQRREECLVKSILFKNLKVRRYNFHLNKSKFAEFFLETLTDFLKLFMVEHPNIQKYSYLHFIFLIF
jgi:hypothetical protein